MTKWRVRFASQWSWPLTDFDIGTVSISFFGPSDYWNIWATVSVVVLGLRATVVIPHRALTSDERV